MTLFARTFVAVVFAFALAGRAAERPPLLEAGTAAPDFTALAPNGAPVKLSDFRGHPVLIDFWATWCGPCKQAMPHIEKIHQALKDQGLTVLGVCVWDNRPAFDAWQKHPEVRTSYLKVFDPVGTSDRKKPRDQRSDIATKLYQASFIPTFYLLDKDGRVLFAGVGSDSTTAENLEQALRRAGFKL